MRFLMSTAIVLCFLLILTGCQSNVVAQPPTAEAGYLDLRDWNFERDGAVALNGDWEFYWQQHLSPADFATGAPQKTLDGFVPGTWNNYELDGETVPRQGFATYRLRLTLPPQQDYGLMVLNIGTAYRMWVNDQLVLSNGIPGQTMAETVPRNYTKIASARLDQPDSEIIMQVSNFHHRHGGFRSRVVLGHAEQVARIFAQRRFSDTFLFGGFVMMGLYYLGLYYFRRQDYYTLYFALYCITMALRLIFVSDKMVAAFQPNLPWDVLLRIDYLTFFVAGPFFLRFLIELYPNEYHRRSWYYYVGLVSIFCLITIFTPPIISSYTIPSFQILTLLLAAYVLGALLLAVKRKRDGAILLLIGCTILVGTMVVEILQTNSLLHVSVTTPMGFLLFMFFQSVVISQRFSRTFNRIESLSEELTLVHYALEEQNHNLEQIVDTRTKALRDANDQLQNDLNLARQLQSGLVPEPFLQTDALTIACHSTAARTVGGDFYSYRLFFDAEPPACVCAVGDVSGKGAGAALLMATALTQFDTLLARRQPPAIAIKQLDQMLLPYTRPSRQNCALCYVELKQVETDGQLRWILEAVNAGGVPPCIKRKDGTVLWPEIGGFALGQGLAGQFDYPTYTLLLEPDDQIILVSDGVLEAKTSAGQMLSFNGLEQLITSQTATSAAALVEQLRQTLAEFTGDAEPDDDVTIMAIQLRS